MSTEEHKIVGTPGRHFHSGITYTYYHSVNPGQQSENSIFPNGDHTFSLELRNERRV